MSREIEIMVDGYTHRVGIEDHWSLLDVLRDKLGIKGVKKGCGEGDCGVCSVYVDGKVINSCLYLAARADGKKVITIAGLGEDPRGKLLQEKFVELGAFQCGYCTPGMIVSASELLAENPQASKDDIKRGMAGNLCRCSGYLKIVEAIHAVGKEGSQR